MGYVNPSSEPEPRGFADQFEYDGHGWLFRRFHRARPVRVTADEMEQCIDFYERWSGRLGTAIIAAAVLSVAVWIYLDSLGIEWADGPPQQGLAAAAMVAIGWIGNRYIWRKATKRFMHRVPVGLGQSWLEDRRSRVLEQGWTDLLTPLLLLGGGAFLLLRMDEISWFELAMASVAGLAALLDLGLKIRSRFL